jgi:hypothetical protein
MLLVELKNIPKDRKNTYGKIVCDFKSHKTEKERVRITVGGRQIGSFQRGGPINSGSHYIQNTYQQHIFHRGGRNDNNGHYKILFGDTIITLRVHVNAFEKIFT